ncbi:MAG TPA: hypothetical protein DCM17_02745 [Dehalococcoidia bacterium]|nr:hypothetical protein [Dehalococcoidia bacterium]
MPVKPWQFSGGFVHLFGEGPGHAVAFPKRGVKDFVNLFLGDALPLQPSAQGSVEVVRTLAFDGWEVSPIVPMLIHPMGGLALESVLIDDGPEVLRIGTPVLRVRVSLSRDGQTQSFQIMLVSRLCPRDLLPSYKTTGWLWFVNLRRVASPLRIACKKFRNLERCCSGGQWSDGMYR